MIQSLLVSSLIDLLHGARLRKCSIRDGNYLSCVGPNKGLLQVTSEEPQPEQRGKCALCAQANHHCGKTGLNHGIQRE